MLLKTSAAIRETDYHTALWNEHRLPSLQENICHHIFHKQNHSLLKVKTFCVDFVLWRFHL